MTRLDEIEARANAATPGPWASRPSVNDRTGACFDVISKSNGNLNVAAGIDEEADVDFIAHAHADVPWLVARVRKLEAALRGVRRRAVYRSDAAARTDCDAVSDALEEP